LKKEELKYGLGAAEGIPFIFTIRLHLRPSNWCTKVHQFGTSLDLLAFEIQFLYFEELQRKKAGKCNDFP